ncbi:MAG: hypothetical protein ACRETD_02050 [Steroidobacteraceae bacterium]
MLSDQTSRNIADAFRRAAGATLVREAGDPCSIVPAANPEPLAQPGSKLLLITISSFVFRLVIIFQVSDAQPTRDYYTGGGSRTLDETFAEMANMCCGALGRELATQFKHLAMSIPYLLECQCMAFLDELKPRLRASYDITISDAARLRVTLCMCCNRQVEFAPAVIEVRHAGGELEIF